MVFRILADATVAFHLAFVLFVVAGGLLVAWRPRVAWLHVPAVVWAAWVELLGWMCPLTPLENFLRRRAGGPVYASSFIEQYLLPVLYPPSLARESQWILGCLVVLLNVAVYLLLRRRVRV